MTATENRVRQPSNGEQVAVINIEGPTFRDVPSLAYDSLAVG